MNIYVWEDLKDGFYSPTRACSVGKDKESAIKNLVYEYFKTYRLSSYKPFQELYNKVAFGINYRLLTK